METARPPGTRVAARHPQESARSSARVRGLDAALPEGEWECVLTLRRQGVTDAGLLRLLRLRTAYRRDADPETDGRDGLQRDPRALFARWLVAQGRLHEGR